MVSIYKYVRPIKLERNAKCHTHTIGTGLKKAEK